MKKFTIKDFILYNGPCFSCGGKININIVNANINSGQFYNLQQSLENNIIELTLDTKYSGGIIVRISTVNNRFEVSNIERFISYLRGRDLCICNSCRKCHNYIYSNPLQFDSKMFVRPITIMREDLSVKSDNITYNLTSIYSENETRIFVQNKNTYKMMNMTIPLFPLYRFKNKDKLISKIKTFILFS